MEEARAKIGIRLADGKFYPILEEGAASKKRLVVTTVKDDQPSVQIDVYRSGEASDAYIGSLIIENIPPRPSGEPDIRLDLGLDDQDNLNAMAREESTGEHQTLAVSLRSLAEEEKYEIPDFDFQEDEEFDLSTDNLPEVNPFEPEIDSEFDSDEASVGSAGTVVDAFDVFDDTDEPGSRRGKPEQKPEKRPRESGRASPVLIGALAALGILLILALAYFIYRATLDRKAEPPQTVSAVAPEKAAPAQVAATPLPAPAPVAPPPAATAAPAVAVATPEPAAKPAEPAKAAEPAKKGSWYKIRWGDTLWDLSIAYYRTPWLYRTIAKANKIKNPDHIISGTWIYIPPR